MTTINAKAAYIETVDGQFVYMPEGAKLQVVAEVQPPKPRKSRARKPETTPCPTGFKEPRKGEPGVIAVRDCEGTAFYPTRFGLKRVAIWQSGRDDRGYPWVKLLWAHEDGYARHDYGFFWGSPSKLSGFKATV